jgi:hypothetical protein
MAKVVRSLGSVPSRADVSRSGYATAMENPDRLEALLTEIRDLVREQTDLYREMSSRAVEHQEKAMRVLVTNQLLYRRVLMAAGLLVLLLLAWMAGLFG